MPNRSPVGAMNSAQISERAAEFAAHATATDVRADARDSYRRLATRYSKLAAERLAQEAQAAGD